MVGRKSKTAIAIAIALIAGMPGAAYACEVFHGVRAKIESGSYRATLNDVFVDDRGYQVSSGNKGSGQSAYEYGLTEWLVPGTNILKIDFDGTAAEFEIFARCKGTYDDDRIVDTVTFTSRSTKQLSFEHEGPLEYTYLKADIAGDEGLLDAVKELQDAARAGDVDTIMAMHNPLIEEFERRAGSAEGVVAYVRGILTDHPIDIVENLTVKPVMGGRVYQILGPDDQSPISVSGKTEDGSFSWTGGAYWALIGDEWAVVAN